MPPVTQEPQLNEPLVNTSAGMETATQTAARARRLVEPTVSATQLTQPTTPVTVPQPQVGTLPAGTLNVARNVSRNAQGFIEAQTAEQAQLRELQNTYGALGNQGSLSDFFSQQREQFGATPENLQELQDIQLRLADMDTESGLRKVEIESGGQSATQGVRSLNQEDRENAVRTAGLAARAAVIQGNINTATQLAKDAVNIEYQQRTLDAQNLLTQIDMLQGQVDDQTAQLLEQEKRTYEAELATIQEVKDNVANAMVNGATQAEISQLTSDQLSDAQKIALAQQITARGAGEMRNLEIASTNASIDASRASTRASNASAALNEAELIAYNTAQADAERGVLTPDQVETANDLNKDFEGQPIVKAYNEGLQSYMVLEDTIANGIEGIEDLQLVYAFMKSVDPTSVVRESEFATAAKTGNIFQGTYARFNGAFNTGGFLPEEVKNDFIRAARSSFKAKNTQYFNVKREYATRVNNTLGINNGADYLTAYEAAAPLTPVDFEFANSLSGATPEELEEILQMSLQMTSTPQTR